VALLFSILASVCFGSVSVEAAAKTDSEGGGGTRLESKEGVYAYDFGDGYFWSYDKNTNTMTISGKEGFPYSLDEALDKAARIDGNKQAEIDWYSSWEEENRTTTLVVEGKITGFSLDTDVDIVVLGKDVKQFSLDQYILKEFKVDSQNPYLADYDGALYTKDYKKLIYCPKKKTSIDFHKNVEIIGDAALAHTDIPTIVIPWGVQKLEGIEFYRTDSCAVVCPDTMLPDTYGGTYIKYIYSTKNRATFTSDVESICDDKTTYDYYGVKPNSLHTFENGKTYFFGPNYEYAKGWKQASGNWYYFNDYGAAVVKIWLKSGNKWYFMQADGTMATNKWVQWYNKWYYVGSDGAMYANRWIKSSGKWYYLGSDGAMYTNRYTPDDCWVNGSGVWVK